jgi:DOMON domain
VLYNNSVWCEAFAANFGHFTIPAELPAAIPGPVALECSNDQPASSDIPDWIATPDGYNCEELNPTIGAAGDAPFHVRWRVDGDWLDVELIGRLPEGEYFGFGVSGATDRTFMIGADVQIGDINGGQPRVRDFFMDQRAQCSGTSGVCRDTAVQFTDDVAEVSGDSQDGITVIRYRKPVSPTDTGLLSSAGVDVDQTVIVEPGVEQFIAWAIGPINPETDNALFHSTAFETGDRTLEFGRPVADNCLPLITDGTFAPTAAPPEPWNIPRIPQTVTEITAHIGPSGGARGYEAITGNSPWGIAWYLNGNLIPQMVMERGTTYNFLVNGGVDPSDDSNYHPFYLTDSSRGGYFQLSPQERLEETPLAGIEIVEADANGVYDFIPTGVAPICRYEVTSESSAAALGPYPDWLSTLDSSCAWDDALTSQAAVVSFTPVQNTPDKIYYHCVTHFDLGFEILVVDEGATLSPTATPTEEPADLTLAALDGQLQGSTLSYRINLADPRAGGQDTVSFIYKTPAEAWVGVGFSNNGGFMIGSEAVIGLPDEGTVLKYGLTLQDAAGVLPLPDAQQTLIDASINQDAGQTTLRFTKIMNEPNEIPINLGANTFLGAWGFGNALSVHQSRESFAINLDSGGVQQLVTGEQSLWKAHGWFASIAWGVLCPLAIGAGLLRKMLKAPLWFQIHRALNMMVIVFTVIAFSLAVAAISRETPAGADAQHFNPEPFPHRLTGLIIFIFAILQAIGGIFRPHATEACEEKTLARKTFEFGHRFTGYSLLALAWYQVDSGIKIYQSIYIESQSTNLLAIFWGVAGGIAGLVVLGFLKIQFFDGGTECPPDSKQLEGNEVEKAADADIESS